MTVRRGALLLTILVAAVAGYFLLGPYLSVDYLVTRETELRDSVEAYPIPAILLGLLVYLIASLIPGTAGKAVIFGWLFGFLPGLLIVNVSLTIVAIATFLLSRYVLADFVRRRFRQVVRFIDQQLQRGQETVLLTLRLLHAPYTVTNYALGTTGVPVGQFWWTTQLGMLPGNIALVWVGASLPSLRELTERGIWELISLPVLVGMTVFAFVPLVVRWLVKKFVPADSIRATTELFRSGPGTEGAQGGESATARKGPP